MRDVEKLAVAQALFKVIAAAVSTKEPDSLRSRVDAETVATYEQTGAKTFDIRINGRVVGTYTVCVSKEEHRMDLAVEDRPAFDAWCLENGLAEERASFEVRMPDEPTGDQAAAFDLLVREGIITERRRIDTSPDAMREARRVLEENGEVPAGCEVRYRDVESEPTGTMLRVDPRLVAQAMGDELTGAVIGLLAEGGGAE